MRDEKGRFIKGMKVEKGPNHHNWKGGRTKDGRGYIWVKVYEHPFSSNNYVREHRLVMEKHIGRYLTKEEVVDHINGIKDDNRIENLRLFSTQAEHITVEGKRGVYIGSHSNQKRNKGGRFV